jgi:putative MATE family efflux protein
MARFDLAAFLEAANDSAFEVFLNRARHSKGSAMSDKTLTSGPVGTALIAMSAPMAIGVLSIMLVGLSDSYFLGQVGEAELAAVGFVYPVMIALTSVGIGLSAGATSVISRALGAERNRDAARLSAHAIGYALALGLAMAGLLALLHEPLLRLMGATGATLEAALAYFRWWIASFPFLLGAMSANAVMRAHGRAAWPAALMSLQSIINVCLTPLFVFGVDNALPAYGAAGAGFATFAARAVEFAVAMFVVGWIVGAVRRSCVRLAGAWTSIREITAIALPAAGTNAINPAGMAIVTAAVATLGNAEVAGFGAATRLQSFVLVPLLALSGGIGPVVGQNWGAGEFGRARRSLSLAWGFALAYGLGIAVILFLFADPIIGLFAPTEAAREAGAGYLRIVGWSLFGYGVLVIGNAALNARGRPAYGLAASVTRTLAVYVPGAWIGASLFGLNGVFVAAIAANLVGVVSSLIGTARAGLFEPPPLPGSGAVRKATAPQ